MGSCTVQGKMLLLCVKPYHHNRVVQFKLAHLKEKQGVVTCMYILPIEMFVTRIKKLDR